MTPPCAVHCSRRSPAPTASSCSATSLELRELPMAAALGAARPFFEDLGEAMAGREVLIVPGNHDHRLAEPLLDAAAMRGEPLGLEGRAAPGHGPGAEIAARLGAAETAIAYPGVWLRDDVYATHGHYMDCHMSLPRIECIAAAAAMRAAGPLPARRGPGRLRAHPAADLRVLLRPRPVGPREEGLAGRPRAPGDGSPALGGDAPAPATWRCARPSRAGSRRRSGRSTGCCGPGSIPISRRRRSPAAAFAPPPSWHCGCRLDAAHLITGHTHRAGPEPGEPEWTLAGGGRLHNTGSWVFASAFHHPGTPPGPYWPGTVTWLEDEGPPRRVRLLNERPREELRRATRR